MIHKGTTRRDFMARSAAALAAPHVITSAAPGVEGAVAASDRIAMGFVGVGGHGISRNLRMFLHQNDAQLVALCDVDQRQNPSRCSSRDSKLSKLLFQASCRLRRLKLPVGSCFIHGLWQNL